MADQVDIIIAELNRFAERLIAKLTLDVTANLVESTPVDTGWARANWVAGIGAPVVKDLSGLEATESGASGANAQQAASLAAVVTGYRIERGAVFVSNNVPYISRLNEGSSQQAPAGFVQNAIAKAVTVDILSLRS